MEKVDSGDTAWVLVSAALVLLMTPALAMFYGGMVRKRNVLSTFMHAFAALPIVSAQWILGGYSLCFGKSYHGLIGDMSLFGLTNLSGVTRGTIPSFSFALFQLMFAIITPALIAGAFAERMKFTTYIAFVLAWTTFVYDPVAHWVWSENGWIAKMGALDFAGGTVVHATAGLAALVCAGYMGARYKYPQERAQPHNLTMTVMGAGLLWFGWLGFNGGSALSCGELAAMALVNTHLGASGGAIAWVVVEWKHRGKPTALGAASGLVAGLVGITPAAGYVAPWAGLVIGLLVGGACYVGVLAKHKFRYDDSLDAFGVHGIGGILGALLTGVFAQEHKYGEVVVGANGLLYGNPKLLGIQALACIAVVAYAVITTWGILIVLKKLMGLRVSESEEREGLDATLHGEEGYAT